MAGLLCFFSRAAVGQQFLVVEPAAMLDLLPLSRREVQLLTRISSVKLGPDLLLLPLQCNGKNAFAHLGHLSIIQPVFGLWCKYCRPRHPRWFDYQAIKVDCVLMDYSRHIFFKTRLKTEDVKLPFGVWLVISELSLFYRQLLVQVCNSGLVGGIFVWFWLLGCFVFFFSFSMFSVCHLCLHPET